MHIEKIISSVIEFVPKTISEILNELSKKIALSDQDRLDLNLILEETITNAIQHGNEFDTSQKVHIILDCDQEQITIRVKDQGKGFNSQNLPDLKVSNEKMDSFGRGIFLIKKLADDVSFNDTGSEVCIRKKIQK